MTASVDVTHGLIVDACSSPLQLPNREVLRRLLEPKQIPPVGPAGTQDALTRERVLASRNLVIEEGRRSAWLYEMLGPHVDELVVAGIT